MPNKTFTQFRVDNVVTTLPTTLAYGQEVYYKDSNGNLILFVGQENGTALPSCGYKEYVALFDVVGFGDSPNLRVRYNTAGFNITATVPSNGIVEFSLPSGVLYPSGMVYSFLKGMDSGAPDGAYATDLASMNIFGYGPSTIVCSARIVGSPAGDPFGIYEGSLQDCSLVIKVFP
jgi:hypothetical protein